MILCDLVTLASFQEPADGIVDGADLAVMTGGYSGSWNYCDLDNDGDSDASDLAVLNANWGDNLGWGLMSNHHNRLGYAGYVFDENLAGTKWHVRHRVLESVLGRWISRDPLGYVDGMSLTAYVKSHPLNTMDSFGTNDICNDNNTQPLLACGNDDTPNGKICQCHLIPAGKCCDDVVPGWDCDFFFWPGKGWFKCGGGLTDCNPTSDDPDASRPWEPIDYPLRTWKGCEKSIFQLCAERCGLEMNCADNNGECGCLHYDYCMWECLQAAAYSVRGVIEKFPYLSWEPCTSPFPDIPPQSEPPITPHRPINYPACPNGNTAP